MRITALLAVIFLSVACRAAERIRLSLLCRGGQVETYFVDLHAFVGKVSDFRLVDERGKDIPFSFDFKLARPSFGGEYLRPPDGFYSKDSAACEENRFRLPGYFSFRAPKNAAKCELSFAVGAAGEWPKSDPSLRPWWIDLVDRRLVFTPNAWTVLKPADIPHLGDTAGRLLTVLARAKVSSEGRFLCQINVPSARPTTPEAVHFYFTGEDEEREYIGVGAVRGGTWTVPKRTGVIGPSGTKLCAVATLEVQSAPGARIEGAIPQTDIAFVGDKIRFTVPQASGEAAFAYSLGKLSVERLYTPKKRLEARAKLVTRDDTPVLDWAAELDLSRVRPGRYFVRTLLTDGELNLSPRIFPLEVVSSPW